MNPGDSLGPYEIKEPLGAGGMGEVYLAEDTRLGRKVAIKVLPAQFAADAERLARFEQEARAAAALNHPHIAVIHDIGFEPAASGPADGRGAADGGAAGAAGGTHYMVQEYLEGQTLRDALAKGSLPLHQALALAAEIGEALGAAHAASIVHRDLKPDNVFITGSGHAKVLDFGLAKLTEPLAGGPQMSMSPTALGTVAGQVMGTAGYMAPEQVNGEDIDARADVFAFGCILYEMATGKRAFSGETVVDTLHAVTRTEPISLRQINVELPAELQRIQNKCMAKDPTRRYQHVADLVVDLNALRIEVEAGAAGAGAGVEAAASATEATAPGVATTGPSSSHDPARAATWRRWALPVAALWALVATVFAVYQSMPEPPVPASVVRFQQPLRPVSNATLSLGVAVSPDGRRLVFTSPGPGGNQLWLRRLDTLEMQPLAGTANAEYPAFGPDSRTLVFVSGGQIRSVDVNAALGADPVAEVSPDSVRGFGWAPDGTLFVGSIDASMNPDGGGIRRLDRATGKLEPVTVVEHESESHRFPQVLPDGRILFTIETNVNSTRFEKEIGVVDPDDGTITKLDVRGTFARYVPSGHLLYLRGDTIVALPFSLERLEATGPEAVVVSDVAGDGDVGHGDFSISDNGVLVYETSIDSMTRLALVDRRGNIDLLHQDARDLFAPRMSPDGRRIAATLQDQQSSDIWLFELERRAFDPFTRIGGPIDAEWSPDGDRLVYQSNHAGAWGVFVQTVGGRDEPQRIELGGLTVFGGQAWHPSGEILGFNATPGDIWTASVDPDGPDERLQITDGEFIESVPAFHPDGNWIAYASNEQGRDQVYVAPYPGSGRRLLASTDGGAEPKWSRDGNELFYRRNSDMMVVAFDADADQPLAAPERLFSLSSPMGIWTIPNYDVTADGRFVMLVGEGGAESQQLVTVMNWFEDLRRLAPRGGS